MLIQLQERSPWSAMIEVTVYRGGRPVRVVRRPNLITDAGFTLLAKQLGVAGTADGGDAQIRWMAWGDDDTTPTAEDTTATLDAELGRKQVSKRIEGDPGVLRTSVFLADGDANTTIEDFRWYASPSATSTPGSGILIARVLFNLEKTAGESVDVTRIDTIGAPA